MHFDWLQFGKSLDTHCYETGVNMVACFTTALEEDILRKNRAALKKNTKFVFSAVNIIFNPCFIPFTG